ncbi:hypothetical protein EC973_006084 [Apophysomyces ossiformis]|uniref:GPI mannosyltransferase 1 n=1 Tax=Apophysomyces ossiformis TaxID=679940 RepID=A0A8H7BDG7_9FUNG|nr:hypothetical protein EC973_006084 [Apophysomyces ossiformis]
MSRNWANFRLLCGIALIFRLVLLLYGEWQDANFVVKYTDIDYVVFTDAARHVTQGNSPYERATYRYTPLLAMLLTPNIWLFRSFGKCLFAAADLVVGYLIHRILVLRGMPSQKALWLDAMWLLNPMVANISTRGNAESLLGVMVLGSLYLLMTRRFYSGCAAFGLAVHFKIYPIIYAVPLLFLLDERYGEPVIWPQVMWSYQQARASFLRLYLNECRPRYVDINQRSETANRNVSSGSDLRKASWKEIARIHMRITIRDFVLFLSPLRIMFAIVSASVFFALTWSMYQRSVVEGL